MNEMVGDVARILLVDDSRPDAVLVQSFLKRNSINVNFDVVLSAEAAIELLVSKNSASLPDLILLDLNMPGMSGVELLAWIRNNSMTAHITVVIYSGSEEQTDIDKVMAMSANHYIQKPLSFEKLKTAIDIAPNLEINMSGGSVKVVKYISQNQLELP